MVSTTAPILILGYVKSTLDADTGLAALPTPPGSIEVVPVPTGAAFPRVVIEAPSSDSNLNALENNFRRIQSRPRVQISVISENANTDAIDAIAARIETVLDGQGSVTVSSGEVVEMSQDSAWYLPALEQNAYRAALIQQYSTAVRTA